MVNLPSEWKNQPQKKYLNIPFGLERLLKGQLDNQGANTLVNNIYWQTGHYSCLPVDDLVDHPTHLTQGFGLLHELFHDIFQMTAFLFIQDIKQPVAGAFGIGNNRTD